MATAAAVAAPVSDVRFGRFLALVYLIMSVGMLVTAFIAQTVSDNPEFVKRTLFNPWFCFGLFMLQILLVVWLAARADTMAAGMAFLLFLVYAAITGIALSSIFIYYSQQTIASAFWAAAGMFLLSGLGRLVYQEGPERHWQVPYFGAARLLVRLDNVAFHAV